MKKHILVAILLLLLEATFAQTKPKPKAVEKPPTQKEVGDMMKEMQRALDEMSPEEKKAMEEMGIKMPDVKNIQKNVSGISDAQMKKAYEDESRIVPKKDVDRIAAIPKTVTDSRIGAYITSIQNKAATLLKPGVKNMADKIYSYIKSKSKNSAEAGNMATGLWIAGKPEIAYYTLGKICADDPTNTDNLSNYASMLSMLGAQHLAIPILNNLNTKFPQNSTLLNNLGQAWFGLGDIAKAEKYLDSTIHIYAYHPQTNLTKATIEESKGNTVKSIEALKKSIKHGYTTEKEDKLRKHGYKLNLNDLSFPYKLDPDPLGLERFRRPDYPMSLNELITLKPLWEKFFNECDDKQAQIENERNAINESFEKEISSVNASFVLPLHTVKANLELTAIKNHFEVEIARLSKQFLILNDDLEKVKGKRKKVDPALPCEFHVKAEDDFLKAYNERKKIYDDDWLKSYKHFINEVAYWSQFTTPNKRLFQLMILESQESWLRKLKEYSPLLNSPRQYTDCVMKKEVIPHGKLADFDDVACQYKSTMDLKIIKFTNNCSRMTSEFDFMFLSYVRKDDFERAEGDTYISSTFKISAEDGIDLKKGPLKLEAKVGVGIEFEFGPQGIEDVVLIGEAKVGAGTGILDEDEKSGSHGIGIAGKDAFPTTVEVGVQGRISINSGKVSVSGTGLLENIKMAEW